MPATRRIDVAGATLASQIDWAEQNDPVVADVMIRVELNLGSEFLLGGEVSCGTSIAEEGTADSGRIGGPWALVHHAAAYTGAPGTTRAVGACVARK
jgi:hypothetical protein